MFVENIYHHLPTRYPLSLEMQRTAGPCTPYGMGIEIRLLIIIVALISRFPKENRKLSLQGESYEA